MTLDFRLEIEKLLAVRKYLSDDDVNTTIHDLAVAHSKQTGVSYTRSCLVLVNMLNTVKQGQVVVDPYTE